MLASLFLLQLKLVLLGENCKDPFYTGLLLDRAIFVRARK